MMGHIHNILIQFVEERLGEDGGDALFAAAGLEPREYLTEVFYPEEEFQSLYRAAGVLFGADERTTQEEFAVYFMAVLPRRFPAIFELAGDARGLLTRVPTIHRQWPSAASSAEFRDKLTLVEVDDSHIYYCYDSPNRLCFLLKRAAELCLSHFGESGSVEETQCLRDGADHCEVHIRFAGCAHE